jgi:hypothetical protein
MSISTTAKGVIMFDSKTMLPALTGVAKHCNTVIPSSAAHRYTVQAVALFLSVSVKQRELCECTFLTVRGGLSLNRKINS